MIQILILTILIVVIIITCSKPKGYPPGPRWYPFIGSAYYAAKLHRKHKFLYKMFKNAVDEFADKNQIIGLKLGRKKVVWVHGFQGIKEMGYNKDLDGRPNGLFFRKRSFGVRQGISFIDGEFHNQQRNFIVSHFKSFGFYRGEMSDYILEDAQALCEYLSDKIKKNEPTFELTELFPVFVVSSLWRFVSNKRYDHNSENCKQLLGTIKYSLESLDILGSWFTHFPFLIYVAPTMSGYSKFDKINKIALNFFGNEVKEHQLKLDLSVPPQDLIDAYLHQMAKENCSPNFNVQQLVVVLFDLFVAGSDTTAKTLEYALINLIKSPEIQKTAQSELDRIIGRDRVPNWSDAGSLPYCNAIISEAIRFFAGYTIFPPHRALRDTTLCGYKIPKDTLISACPHGYLMNGEYFSEPHKFRPERYLEDGASQRIQSFAFGFGTRHCLGENVAKKTLFLFLTTMLQRFTFTTTQEEKIKEIKLQNAFFVGVQSINVCVRERTI